LIIAVAMSGESALGTSEFVRPMPRLVWNASASAPLGFYWVRSDQAASHGDFVLAALLEAARRLAAARGYLPAGVPMVKRVAALTGDVVCADYGIVVINDRVAAQTLLMDRQGRPISAWSGCRVLADSEVFLLMEGVRDSFDGRYFGPIDASAIIGRPVPIWTWWRCLPLARWGRARRSYRRRARRDPIDHLVLVAASAVNLWQPFITEASQRLGIPELGIRAVMQFESV
jgi:conjugative transfer signal peptidase TraF